MIDQDLLDILACPSCRAEMRLDGDWIVCTGGSSGCGLRFPIRDGIPILLVDEARKPGHSDAADAAGSK